MSGNDDCLNEEIISLGGTRSRGTVEYEEYWDEDGQEDHLVVLFDSLTSALALSIFVDSAYDNSIDVSRNVK